MHQYATMETRILNRPSRMKIQDHAARPPTPDISAMPRARMPPKAPARVAALKKRAILNPHSSRIYLVEISCDLNPDINTRHPGLRGNLPLRYVVVYAGE